MSGMDYSLLKIVAERGECNIPLVIAYKFEELGYVKIISISHNYNSALVEITRLGERKIND